MPTFWGHGCSPEPVLVADRVFHQEDVSRLSKGSANPPRVPMMSAPSSEPVCVHSHGGFLAVRWLWAHNTKYRPNSMLTGLKDPEVPSKRAKDEFLRCSSFENLHTLFSLPLIHHPPTVTILLVHSPQEGRYPWRQRSPGGWATVYRWNCGPGWAPAAAGTYLVRDTFWVSSLAVSQTF